MPVLEVWKAKNLDRDEAQHGLGLRGRRQPLFYKDNNRMRSATRRKCSMKCWPR